MDILLSSFLIIFTVYKGKNDTEEVMIMLMMMMLIDEQMRGIIYQIEIGSEFNQVYRLKRMFYSSKKYAKIRNRSNQNPNPALKTKTGK